SPWYPTMRLYRQPAIGEWGPVLGRLAVDLAHRAQVQAAVLPAAPSTAAEAFAEAMRLHRGGRIEEAEPLLRRFLAAEPENVRALYYLGLAAGRRADYAAAEKLFERAVALAPAYADAHYNLGNALLAGGRPETAVKSYRRALALEPDAAEA